MQSRSEVRAFRVATIHQTSGKIEVKAREMVEKAEALKPSVNLIRERKKRLLNFLKKARDHYDQIKCFIVIIQS